MIELDNVEKVINQERSDLDRDLASINPSIKVVNVVNYATCTDFILSYQSTDYEEAISDYVKAKTLSSMKYEGGITRYNHNAVDDNPTKKNDPRCPREIPVSKETLYIRRNALIPFKRPFKLTLCIQGALGLVICWAVWLSYRILFITL